MQDADIRFLVYEVLATYTTIEVYADVDKGVVHLVGEVNSEEQREAIEEEIRAIDGVRGLRNELQIEFVPPEGAHLIFRPQHAAELDEPGSDISIAGTEYDFNDATGTTDVMEAGSEAEPFFPPTDVVVRPVPETREGFEVVGGFSGTSMDQTAEEQAPVSGVTRGDEEMADDVRRELREDAMTTDLDIRVTVRNGVAYLRGSVSSLDDVESAEEVAARVPGVVEVREQLDIAA